jgi:hypothetical protein
LNNITTTNFKTSKLQNFKTSKLQNFKTSKLQNFKTSKLQNFKTSMSSPSDSVHAIIPALVVALISGFVDAVKSHEATESKFEEAKQTLNTARNAQPTEEFPHLEHDAMVCAHMVDTMLRAEYEADKKLRCHVLHQIKVGHKIIKSCVSISRDTKVPVEYFRDDLPLVRCAVVPDLYKCALRFCAASDLVIQEPIPDALSALKSAMADIEATVFSRFYLETQKPE